MTESGKVFYEYAQGILKQIDDARTAVRAPDSIVGSVIVGVPQSISAALALPLLQAAREQLPQVSLHLNEELTGNLLDQLRQGRVDMTLFTSNVPSADFHFERVVEEDFYWIHGANQPAPQAHAGVTLEAIAAQPLIVSAAQHNHCLRAVIEQVFSEQGVPMPPLAAEINSVQILKRAVQAGIAPTILPLALVAQEVAASELVAHPIRCDTMRRILGICVFREMPLTHAKRAVRELIGNVMRDLCARGDWPGARAVPTDGERG
ncbi:LysR substrate-binding domain-containing protein [Cupriavidus consociatus]|uniref:LysR substrate-binding domain-containing protein n=1 Tax=Cupriavidus consociatus TaxID=2821357 RepID=UPI0024DF7970|nr:LysR substrate-binding domain-containing protein [Cupriavidus sp. LEh21]MDK2662008.1 LysR substrate-binding domain-containing protein [Cupriavidus sp. LEh21]